MAAVTVRDDLATPTTYRGSTVSLTMHNMDEAKGFQQMASIRAWASRRGHDQRFTHRGRCRPSGQPAGGHGVQVKTVRQGQPERGLFAPDGGGNLVLLLF